MRIKKVVIGIVTVLVCIVIAASTLFVLGQQGQAWLSMQYRSGGKFVAVQDKETISLLKDAVKEVRNQGQKVDAADYEPTYGSSLFLVNWICPIQIKGAYPKSAVGQRDDGYLVQIGFETYQISEEQYNLLFGPPITALYGED